MTRGGGVIVIMAGTGPVGCAMIGAHCFIGGVRSVAAVVDIDCGG
jgi:hypothetical protein